MKIETAYPGRPVCLITLGYVLRKGTQSNWRGKHEKDHTTPTTTVVMTSKNRPTDITHHDRAAAAKRRDGASHTRVATGCPHAPHRRVARRRTHRRAAAAVVRRRGSRCPSCTCGRRRAGRVALARVVAGEPRGARAARPARAPHASLVPPAHPPAARAVPSRRRHEPPSHGSGDGNGGKRSRWRRRRRRRRGRDRRLRGPRTSALRA